MTCSTLLGERFKGAELASANAANVMLYASGLLLGPLAEPRLQGNQLVTLPNQPRRRPGQQPPGELIERRARHDYAGLRI